MENLNHPDMPDEIHRHIGWHELSSRARFVFTLCRIFDRPDNPDHITLSNLIHLTGMSTENVQKACNELQMKGWIKWDQARGCDWFVTPDFVIPERAS